MNAVGIDVSKNKSMVAVARPLGQVVVKPLFAIFLGWFFPMPFLGGHFVCCFKLYPP